MRERAYWLVVSTRGARRTLRRSKRDCNQKAEADRAALERQFLRQHALDRRDKWPAVAQQAAIEVEADDAVERPPERR